MDGMPPHRHRIVKDCRTLAQETFGFFPACFDSTETPDRGPDARMASKRSYTKAYDGASAPDEPSCQCDDPGIGM